MGDCAIAVKWLFTISKQHILSTFRHRKKVIHNLIDHNIVDQHDGNYFFESVIINVYLSSRYNVWNKKILYLSLLNSPC